MPIGYMYILECENGCFYTGSTTNLERRISEHFNGRGSNYTKKYKPVRVVYVEQHSRIDKAFEREKQVQSWSQAKKRALIEGSAYKLPKLAQCKNETSHKRLSRLRGCRACRDTRQPRDYS